MKFQDEPAWVNRNTANQQAEVYVNTGWAVAPGVAKYIANGVAGPGETPIFDFAVKGDVTPALVQAVNDRIGQADEEGDPTTRQQMIALLGYIEAVTG